MREYLEKLLAEQKWEEAEKYAEQMLLSRDATMKDVLACQMALLQSRVKLNQFEKALGPGQLAIELAGTMGEWDSYGLACFFLGSSYGRLGRHGEAVHAFMNYLARAAQYTIAREYEVAAWYVVGKTQEAAGETDQALSSFRTALAIAEKSGDPRKAYGVRRALIEQYMEMGDFVHLPRLLAQNGSYLRHHPTEAVDDSARLFYIELCAKFAVQTGRLARGRLLALRGLHEAGNDMFIQGLFHLVLADIARKSGNIPEALGHATAARICGNRASRRDLEDPAANLVYELLQAFPNGIAELDRYYLSVGS